MTKQELHMDWRNKAALIGCAAVILFVLSFTLP